MSEFQIFIHYYSPSAYIYWERCVQDWRAGCGTLVPILNHLRNQEFSWFGNLIRSLALFLESGWCRIKADLLFLILPIFPYFVKSSRWMKLASAARVLRSRVLTLLNNFNLSSRRLNSSRLSWLISSESFYLLLNLIQFLTQLSSECSLSSRISRKMCRIWADYYATWKSELNLSKNLDLIMEI